MAAGEKMKPLDVDIRKVKRLELRVEMVETDIAVTLPCGRESGSIMTVFKRRPFLPKRLMRERLYLKKTGKDVGQVEETASCGLSCDETECYRLVVGF